MLNIYLKSEQGYSAQDHADWNRVKRWQRYAPEVFLAEEAHVPVVDVELEVVGVAVEGDDLALRVRRHPLEQDALVVFDTLHTLLILLRIAGELHLRETPSHRRASAHPKAAQTSPDTRDFSDRIVYSLNFLVML